MTLPFIFDGHNDVLSKIAGSDSSDAIQRFVEGNQSWHLDMPRMQAGNLLGGFFAIWGMLPEGRDYDALMAQASYDVPLPAEFPQPDAMDRTMHLASILLELQNRGALTICTSAQQIRATADAGKIAAIMHIEGAEAIGPDLYELEVLYAAGLRSVGPVWSRNNIFCDGVPFRFPGSPDSGGGLTNAGRDLVARCNELRVLVDLSHMTEAGFWNVAEQSKAPLVATHSCVHALCESTRNLTDKQLKAVADSGGVVGLNYASQFLRTDGKRTEDVPLALLMTHLDHMLNVMGEENVALGSDYDGATVPQALDGADRMPNLIKAMEQHGYSEDRITRIAHGNWLRVLTDTWGN